MLRAAARGCSVLQRRACSTTSVGCSVLQRRACSTTSLNTHLGIDRTLSGSPVELRPGFARVSMTTTPTMSADGRGLTHGGFYFGLADYAAMCAVNDPNVVLGSAEARFLKPVKCGDSLTAEAKVSGEKGKKRVVDVTVTRGDEVVFAGNFVCFVLERHVLD